MNGRWKLRVWLGLLSMAAFSRSAEAQPTIQLKVPQFHGAAFPNFSSVVLPQSAVGPVEIWLEGALAEIQVSTVRVKLNDTPFTPFVAINPLPRGFRAILKLGASLRPEYTLRQDGENLITFVAMDESKVTYQGQFYLVLDARATAPALASKTHAAAPVPEVKAPEQKSPPEIAFGSEWPAKTTEQYLPLVAEITDREGLRRVVIEVNGKDVEEVVMENELPIRKKDGFRVSGKLAGEVTGDGRKVSISVPVKLKDGINVVALRAENTVGLRKRIDRAVEMLKKPK